MQTFYCAGDACRYGKKSRHFLSSGERNGRSPNQAHHGVHDAVWECVWEWGAKQQSCLADAYAYETPIRAHRAQHDALGVVGYWRLNEESEKMCVIAKRVGKRGPSG